LTEQTIMEALFMHYQQIYVG